MKDLERDYPEKYKAIMKTVYNEGNPSAKIDYSRFGFDCICFPKSIETIPDYLLPFIDYEEMGRNNMTNGYILLESLGIYIESVRTTPYRSNIIEI